VITSSESASSIDTQFNALCEELTQAGMIPIILDEKKCGNLKQTIMYLQSRLKSHFGLNTDDYGG
jgi:septum formation inhibitor MinC